jgi:hypothetical protein
VAAKGAEVKLGDPLPLNDKGMTLLAGELCEMKDELEEESKDYFSDISCWWAWYHAIPDTEWRSDPFDGASNIQIPVIQTQVDPMVARTLLQLMSSSTFWTGGANSDEWERLKGSMFEFLNWGVYHQPGANLFDTLEPGITEQQNIGEVVWEQRWVKKTRPVVTPNGRVQLMSFGEGPTAIHRPRERYLFSRTTTIDQADCVFVQDFHSTSQLQRIALNDPKAIKSAFVDLPQGLEGAAADLENERRERSGQSPFDDTSRFAPHDVRTIHIEVPLQGLMQSLRGLPKVNSNGKVRFDEEVPTPCEVTLHVKSKKILKAIYHPLLLDSAPFYMATRKRGGSATEAGRGMAKDGEQLQRAICGHYNQSSDSVTVANALKLWTSDRNLEGKRWSPNKINFSSNLNEMGLKEYGSGVKNIQPDMALLQFLQAYAERSGGAADPVQGRESRMGGHPSPATNFLGMLQQSQINSSRSLKSLRTCLSKMGEHRALMYQQFETNKGDWIGKVFGVEDRERIMEYLEAESPLYGQVNFDIHAFSEVHNPDAERQKAVVISQMVTNHYITAAKYVEVIENPQAPPRLKALMEQALTALTKSTINFLEAAEVDEYEDYVNALDKGRTQSIDALRGLLPPQLGGGGQQPGAGLNGGGGGPPSPAGPGGPALLPGAGMAPLPGPGGGPLS